jgi:hypothetical protein
MEGAMAYISKYQVKNANPVVTFEIASVHGSAVAERFVSIAGDRLYYLGMTCDTCAYLFEKRGYTSRLSPAALSARLESAERLLAPDLLGSVGDLLESGTYSVVETAFVPQATGPCEPSDYFGNESIRFFGLDAVTGVPDNPRVRYWRGGDSVLPNGLGAPRRSIECNLGRETQLFFHLVVPMEPPHVLSRERIDYYGGRLEMGESPAAAGVSVLDVRAKAILPGDAADPAWRDATLWCLTTLLLDGHHKVQAAAELGRKVRLLTFLAHAPSVAEKANFEPVLRELASWQ